MVSPVAPKKSISEPSFKENKEKTESKRMGGSAEAFNEIEDSYENVGVSNLDTRVSQAEEEEIIRAAFANWAHEIVSSHIHEKEIINDIAPDTKTGKIHTSCSASHEKDSAIWRLEAHFSTDETPNIGPAIKPFAINLEELRPELEAIFDSDDARALVRKSTLEEFMLHYFSTNNPKDRQELVEQAKKWLDDIFSSKTPRFINALEEIIKEGSTRIHFTLENMNKSLKKEPLSGFIYGALAGVKTWGTYIFLQGYGAAKTVADAGVGAAITVAHAGMDTIHNLTHPTQKVDRKVLAKQEIQGIIKDITSALVNIKMSPQATNKLEKILEREDARIAFRKFLTALKGVREEQIKFLLDPKTATDADAQQKKDLEFFMKLSMEGLHEVQRLELGLFIDLICKTLMDRAIVQNMQILTDPLMLAVVDEEIGKDSYRTFRYANARNRSVSLYTDPKYPEYFMGQNGMSIRYDGLFAEDFLWHGFQIEKDTNSPNKWNVAISFGILNNEIATVVLPIDLSNINADQISNVPTFEGSTRIPSDLEKVFSFIVDYLNEASEAGRKKVIRTQEPILKKFLNEDEVGSLKELVERYSDDSYVLMKQALLSLGDRKVRFPDVHYEELTYIAPAYDHYPPLACIRDLEAFSPHTTLTPAVRNELTTIFKDAKLREAFNQYILKALPPIKYSQLSLLSRPDVKVSDLMRGIDDYVTARDKFLLENEEDYTKMSKEAKQLLGIYVGERATFVLNSQLITDNFMTAILDEQAFIESTGRGPTGSSKGAREKFTDPTSPEYRFVKEGLYPRHGKLWQGFSILRQSPNIWSSTIKLAVLNNEIATASIPLDLSSIDAESRTHDELVTVFSFIRSYINSEEKNRGRTIKEYSDRFKGFLTETQIKDLIDETERYKEASTIQFARLLASVGDPKIRFPGIEYLPLESKKQEREEEKKD